MTTLNLTPEMVTADKANYLFDHVCESSFQKIWCKLRGKAASTMTSIHDMLGDVNIANSEAGGRQRVNLEQICGTVSAMRAGDFDADFRPRNAHLKSRWVRIAEAFMSQTPVPPVELVELDGKYFVRDGHHRVSVAKSLGQSEILATVTRCHAIMN